MRTRRIGARLAMAVAVATVTAGCASPTDSADVIPVAFEHVSLQSDAEREAWPRAPEVSGGDALELRGRIVLDCGSKLRARADRRGGQVTVTVENVVVDPDRACWTVVMEIPFRATISSLEAGTYQVQVRVRSAGANVVSRSEASIH